MSPHSTPGLPHLSGGLASPSGVSPISQAAGAPAPSAWIKPGTSFWTPSSRFPAQPEVCTARSCCCDASLGWNGPRQRQEGELLLVVNSTQHLHGHSHWNSALCTNMIPLTAALGAGAASPASWGETEAHTPPWKRHPCATGTATPPGVRLALHTALGSPGASTGLVLSPAGATRAPLAPAGASLHPTLSCCNDFTGR